MKKAKKKISKYEKYKINNENKGLQKIHPWVPERDREQVLGMCAMLREKWANEQQWEELKTLRKRKRK